MPARLLQGFAVIDRGCEIEELLLVRVSVMMVMMMPAVAVMVGKKVIVLARLASAIGLAVVGRPTMTVAMVVAMPAAAIVALDQVVVVRGSHLRLTALPSRSA